MGYYFGLDNRASMHTDDKKKNFFYQNKLHIATNKLQ